ncbi:MAG: hypothetical protein LC808_07440 [Actinobacteria bacterium]|nr:hypothetical protein [Actinomycetota bacterium]
MLLLRSFALMRLAATVMALWVIRSGMRHQPRLPVPLLWLVVAVLLWNASA